MNQYKTIYERIKALAKIKRVECSDIRHEGGAYFKLYMSQNGGFCSADGLYIVSIQHELSDNALGRQLAIDDKVIIAPKDSNNGINNQYNIYLIEDHTYYYTKKGNRPRQFKYCTAEDAELKY